MQRFNAVQGSIVMAAALLLFASPAVSAQVNAFSVSGQVYNDLNGNGSNDGVTDPTIDNVEIDLLDGSNTVLATVLSGPSGAFTFSSVAPGSYKLKEVIQAGWILTQPVGNLYNVTGSAGDALTGFDFGNFQTVSVSGNIYNDLNGNGSQNGGEPPLSGWTAEVRDGSNVVVGTATSDASGNYTVHGLGPGSFSLDNVVLPGWHTTQPTNPTFYSFTTSSGVNVVGGIFGNHQDFKAVPEPGLFNSLGGLLVSCSGLLIRRRR